MCATLTVVDPVAATRAAPPRLRGKPDRIFISVDESTGRSTVSFAPADVGSPFSHDGDHKGTLALEDAKKILQQHPGCTIHGPHFHAARPAKARIRPRRPAGEKPPAMDDDSVGVPEED
jgi:hypothetical protein